MKTKKPPLLEKIKKALKRAAIKAAKDHKEKKLPLILWKDGRIVKVPVHKI